MFNVWFTSDTHFGAERTLKLSKRPFENVEEMNKKLIENWNKVVGVDDVVYHLGDFGDYEFANQLNGHIRLVIGNYERRDINLGIDFNDKFEFIYKEDFQTIWTELYNEKNRLTTTYKITMSHEPSFVRNVPIGPTEINLFGHVHKLSMVKRYGLNVGVDCHNFYPISLEDVLHYHNAILNFYDEEVFD